MKNKKKIVLGIVVVLAIMFLSVTGYKLLNKKSEEDPEILRSRTYAQVEEGDEAIDGTEYVTFDAYYLRDLNGDGYAEKLRGTCREVGTQDTLYMDLNVLTNGTLEDAKITIDGKNFYFSTAIVKDSVIAQDYIGTNTKEIKLNNVTSGTQKLIFGMVQSGDYTRDDLKAAAIGNDTNKYSIEDNTITLTGTHVSDNGERTEISKTVYLTNDWHGTTQASIYLPDWLRKQEYDISDSLNEEDGKVDIKFTLVAREEDNKLILSNQNTQIEVPELMGYKAIGVSVDNKNAIVNYDSELGVATIDLTSVKNESGIVSNTIPRELTYEITISYPYEAYQKADESGFALNIPVDVMYSGHNNPSQEFQNPYVSNTAEGIISVLYGTPKGEVARVDVSVGKIEYIDNKRRYVVSKAKPMSIYNNINSEQTEDNYEVRWILHTGTQGLGYKTIINEPENNYSDEFLDVNSNYSSMEEYISNVGIYFSNPEFILKEDGYINVYDNDSQELLHTFTKNDWNDYNEYNPYKYNRAVKHIRIETSEISSNSSLTVHNIKQIDDIKLTSNIDEESFNNLSEIYSYCDAYLGDNEGNKTSLNMGHANAIYEMPYSYAEIYLNTNLITNQVTLENAKININTNSNNIIRSKWGNGEFLIKYPKEIIDVKVNNVVSNDNDVLVTSTYTYEENENIYTKIYVSNDEQKDINLELDADITADPRSKTLDTKIELYYYNPLCSNYYTDFKVEDNYDVNSNENLGEFVGYSSSELSIIAPSTLITSQTGYNFDDNNSTVIAPQIASIEKSDESSTASVDINITNNYSGTISEISIIGKIPFKGNTYQINGQDMESEFSTFLTEEGIIVPDDIKDYATVYYSYNEIVTNDLNDISNNWTTTPEDMSRVKSYMINLGEYVMPVGEVSKFSYTIQVPSGIDYNKTAYSNHAIYFCLDTEQGKLRTQTETSKLGFSIEEKYNLQITKKEMNSEKTLQGVVFVAQEAGTEKSISSATNNQGIAVLKDLKVEKEYTIKEIKTDENHILSKDSVKIIGHIVNGQLQVEELEGEFLEAPIVEYPENSTIIAKIPWENEVKYNFILNKTEVESNDSIEGIRFLLSGSDGTRRTLTTDENGNINVKLLSPNVQYILDERESQGYYLKESISFMMVRNKNKELEFKVLSGDFDKEPILTYDDIVPEVVVGLENENIPKYTLKVTKKEINQETIIPNTTFNLSGEGRNENFVTDENGFIEINDLYEYVEGRNIEGIYTLKETMPADGYVLNDEPIQFKVERNESGEIEFILNSGNIKESETIVDNNNSTVSITLENSPIFTLRKVDADTNQPLEDVEFKITDIDGNYVTDVDGNIVGEGTETDITDKIQLITQDNGWIEKSDSVWESQNIENNVENTAFGVNDYIYIENQSILSFEWAKSVSENDKLQFNIMKFENLDSEEESESKTYEINKNSYTEDIESLEYEKVNLDLSPGYYQFWFDFYKDLNTEQGLNKAFVKNIKLVEGTKTLKTDKDGFIKVRLSEGLYKAIETKTLEGYELSKEYNYFGIGESKEATYSWKDIEEYNNEVNFKEVESLADGGIILTGDDKTIRIDKGGNVLWSKDISGSGIGVLSDGFAVVNNSDIIKLDFDGNILWKYHNPNGLNLYDVAETSDGLVAVSGFAGSDSTHTGIIKLSYSGELIWENLGNEYQLNYCKVVVEDDYIYTCSKGNVLKFDLNGKKIFSTNVGSDLNVSDLTIVGDSVFLISSDGVARYNKNNGTLIWLDENNGAGYTGAIDYANDGIFVLTRDSKLLRYDVEGNITLEKENYDYDDITIVDNNIIAINYSGKLDKLDLEGNIIDSKLEYISHSSGEAFCKTSDGYIFSAYDDGTVSKINENGEIIWVNRLKNYNYEDAKEVNDGIIAIATTGQLVKYNLDGEIIWENVDKTYKYNNIELVDDGIIAVSSEGMLVKYNLDGSFAWEKLYKNDYSLMDVVYAKDGLYVIAYNGTLLKYDLNGNLEWESTSLNDTAGYSAALYGAVAVDDGIIVLGYSQAKYGYDGELKQIYELNSYGSGPCYVDGVKIDEHNVIAGGRGKTFAKFGDDKVSYYTTIDYGYIYEDMISVDDYILAMSYDGTIVKYKNIVEEPEIPEEKSIIVKNDIAKYKITTRVDGYGGIISGMNEDPYEEVQYMEDSKKDIVITPSRGYEIESIKINGKIINYNENSNGMILLDKFYKMTEDKEVVVKFVPINDNTFTIRKIDSVTGNPIANVRFNIEWIETRKEPSIEKIAGEIVGDGPVYYAPDFNNKLENVVGDFVNNGNYYFVEEDGKYVSNNVGISNSTANSYVKIDLKNYSGKYMVVLNANISSQRYSDSGYAIITEDTIAPEYYDSYEEMFMNIDGTSSDVSNPKDYITTLDGGKEYYLHLGYYKDSRGNSGDDRLTINSINLYKAIESTYTFVDNGNGGYESNNQGKDNTEAIAYIPLDLTGYEGKYNLTINANVSSEEYEDYGIAYVSNENTYQEIFYLNGTTGKDTLPNDYSIVIDGGQNYRLYFEYYKNDSVSQGDDKLTINNINITLNQDDYINQEMVTNSDGEIYLNIPNWQYKITEIETPEDYELNSTPIIYNFDAEQENILTIENNPKAKVIVHHYIKDTENSVAPDEYITGEINKEYITSPKTDLEEYELVKNEDGSYQIPENASGVFTEETQVVTYYYEKKPLHLIVHHYIDGTEDSVAPDEVSQGKQGQEYTTSPVEYPDLDEKYELVQEKLPENASGTLEDKVTEVTYYYRVKEHKITTEVDGVGGTISGQGETPYETVLHNEDGVKDIIVTPNSGYEIESITINGEEQELPEDKLSEYTLDKFTNVVEDKHVVVKFKTQEMDIFVDKVWEDNGNEAGKRPQEIEIQLYSGSTLVSSIKMNEENNGRAIEEMSLDNTNITNRWSTRFENVPIYDENGNQIDYTVVEKEVNTNDLYFYDTTIEKIGLNSYIITNTFNVPDEKIDIEVTKKWEDDSNVNGLRPQEIKFQVKNGEEVVQEQIVNVESGNEQKYTFTDLSKYDEFGNEIKYTVDEAETVTDGLKFYSKAIDNNTHTVTNTFTVPDEKTSIEVTKKWEDESNVNNTRPSQIVIQVKNGETVVQSNTVDVTDEDEKVYTFEDLAKYDENGQEIEYTVDEKEVNKDELIEYEKNVEGRVITNTLKSHKITTEVKGIGGSISGQNDNPYEEVLHKGDSVKDITVTPQEEYEIAKITINGEDQELPEDKKVSYTLDKFIEVIEDKHVVVEFKKIEYKITTEVEGDGGQISGEGETSYETVINGENSIKDIVCTPENGYRIESITVNGEPIEFTENEDGTYTLDKFINMTEDKHIIVKYVKKDTSVIVKHVTEDGIDLVEPETIEGKVGDTYNTEEKEFDDYEIKIIPENADGVMEEEQIEVIYVYSQVKGKITVTKVDISDTNTKLTGATFKLEKLDADGNVDTTFAAQEKTTGTEGTAEFSELLVGKYQITEIKAPEGFELNTEVTEVEVTKANRELNVTVKNREKLTLPETGKINYTIVISGIGLAVMLVAVLIKKFKSTKVN